MTTSSDDQRHAMVSFLTTELATLQSVRSSTDAETNSRLQLYLGVLSSSILTIALAAQVAAFDDPLFALAIGLLAVVYLLGVATIGRLTQVWREWFLAGQAMSRIRRYFVDVAPDAARYLSMPTSDDPDITLRGAGIQAAGHWWEALVSAVAVVGVINSVVAGAIAGLISALLTDGRTATPTIAGIASFFISFAVTARFVAKQANQHWESAEVRFPPE